MIHEGRLENRVDIGGRLRRGELRRVRVELVEHLVKLPLCTQQGWVRAVQSADGKISRRVFSDLRSTRYVYTTFEQQQQRNKHTYDVHDNHITGMTTK